ncbi:18030_t:CDS:2 [Racocetra persica]|uniref:18030_t:CDS:1 n=1 Tax=Racocetra persica TaxID=160502 RepID=A0ACA9QZV3_9GLOM|nr:18030_t:CDS:2 [Racocetra persica]
MLVEISNKTNQVQGTGTKSMDSKLEGLKEVVIDIKENQQAFQVQPTYGTFSTEIEFQEQENNNIKIMKEVIILEVSGSKKSHLVQGFLKSKKIDYRILTKTQLELNNNSKEKEQLKKRLIAAYQRQAKNKKLQSELALWDSISGDGL